MSKLVVSSYIGDGELWIYLDDAVVVRNSEAAEVALKDERSYFIHWFVEAPPGTPYTITISSPREAQFQLTKSIGSGGKEGGNFCFKG